MKELIASLLLLVLVALLLNPFHFWMPMPMQIMILGALVAAFAAIAAFVLKEGSGDERDTLLRMYAGRTAFLAGAAVLVLGVAVESLSHAVDPWLVGALALMVVGKLCARWWGDRYR